MDTSYVGLVKKVAKLIKGFPRRLIFADKKDGGLGITSTLSAAMERKRKMMLDLVHRGVAPGRAMEGKISRMMRDAGQGGLGPCRRHLWPALGDLARGISSLVWYLKTIGLRIRVGYAETEGWELACNLEQNLQARIDMNARGIVLQAKLGEGSEIPIRVGQCWEMQGRALEILGFRGDDIEIMEWECGHSLTIGGNMEVRDGNRPQGMGGLSL